AVVNEPLHTVWFDGAVTDGVGFTVMVKLLVAPTQVPYRGVTVIVATVCTPPAFTAVNEAMLPLPLEASPMLVLSLVQV
ncbi:hypothetical protein, partial [Tolypothrix sp. VBCCA 56010]|uniref:hypothetical protein n=1 Tax=Tolypothrix sp. VBCCA 56010 TaxID=3137731 RepID=UPI003D7DF89A